MKRLLLLLALLCLLAGCAQRAPREPAAAAAAPPETTAAAEPESTPAATKAPALLDGKQPADRLGALFQVPCAAAEDPAYQAIAACGDDLLLSGASASDDPDCTFSVAILDLETGRLRAKAQFPGVEYAAVYVRGSRVAVCDSGGGRILILDGSLRQVAEQKIESNWNPVCVDTAMKTGFSFQWEGGIRTVDLQTGETGMLLEGARNLSTLKFRDDMVFLSYLDPKTQLAASSVLNLRTDALEPVPLEGDFLQLDQANGAWLCGLQFQADTYYYGPASAPRLLTQAGAWSLAADGRLLLTGDQKDGVVPLRLYDGGGRILTGCDVPCGPDEYLSVNPVWSEKYHGCFFTVTKYPSRPKLFYWDTSVSTGGGDLRLEALPDETPQAGSAVTAELYERAAALSARYGVTVRIADQCPTEYQGYTALQNTDEQQISAGLSALETALSGFPDGFFPQLRHGYLREIGIDLVGKLTRRDLPAGPVNGYTEFSAFAEPQGDRTVMVLDLGQQHLAQNCCHEIAHLIDDRLQADALFRENALYSEAGWAARNPEGFHYVCSYFELPESVYSDGWDGYFIDTYARTYPTEDRARIFEYAMSDSAWRFGADHPHLRAKLRYYSDCIRDCFDTTGWPAATRWEKPLQTK